MTAVPSSTTEASRPRGGAISRILVASVLLAIVEVVATVGFGYGDFLSDGERMEAALANAMGALVAVGLAIALVELGGAIARRSPESRRDHAFRLLTFVVTALVVLPFLVELTNGRRVRDLPLRPVGIGVVAVASAALVSAIRSRLARGASAWIGSVSATALVVAAILDRRLLPHLYPAFHLGLGLVATFAAVVSAYASPLPTLAFIARRPRLVASVVAAAILGSIAGLAVIGGAPNTSFVLEERAVVTGKWIGLANRIAAASIDDVPQVDISARATRAPGISIAGRDVLLITVDALRADRLSAYGGHGLTPAIDRLADEGAVFTRAFTTTPHTSYALASLLTGKYLRPVFELPNASPDHVTMPDRFRRYGYRTAAFYPPAIFFVDAERFSALEAEGFGFEYRKQMYAPARDRVTQVESYLDEVPQGFPVFVWVHFFEPHEPYDPPRDVVHGEGDEALYDGEVATVDAAVDALVRSFRARRPGATVVLTADHGEEFQDHGGRYHGSTLYDEQVRVPLVWSSPGVVSHRVIAAPVEHVDLATTLLTAAGVPTDVRMRGDDLGPLLAGTTTDGPRFAFADIADQRMVVDGRYKAICESRSPRCQLFDLREDPRERRNLAGVDASTLDRLRGALSSFTASIPRFEGMALDDDAAFPPELARAELGDRAVAPELIPLLDSPRAEVRASAARFLGRLGHADARARLESLASGDPDAAARAEAAIAATSLGSDATVEATIALASIDDERGLFAGLALASRGNAAGAERLAGCVGDARRDEVLRRECVVAIGTSSAVAAIPSLVAALDDVRLRTDVATVLGRLGDRSVAAAIYGRLEEERYVPPRLALAEALFRLGDRRFEAATKRYLGMASGMPGGVGLLLDAGRLTRPSGRGGDLRGAAIDGFRCESSGCVAGPNASLPVTATGSSRVVVRVVAGPDALVRIGDQTFGPLPEGASELSVAGPTDGSRALRVRVDGDVRFVAYVVVASTSEIPPPAPVPWDGGVPAPSQ